MIENEQKDEREIQDLKSITLHIIMKILIEKPKRGFKNLLLISRYQTLENLQQILINW